MDIFTIIFFDKTLELNFYLNILKVTLKGEVYCDKGKNRPIFRFFFLTKYDSYIKLNETVIFIIYSSICKKIFKSKYSKLPSWHSFKRRSVFFRCPNGVHEISRLGDMKQKKKYGYHLHSIDSRLT